MENKIVSRIDIFIRYEDGKLRIEAPLEYNPFEVKEILDKANTMIGKYIFEITNNKTPTDLKGTLKLTKLKD